MLLIAGLGNPGKEYDRTRHNAGFLAVEQFRDAHRTAFGEWRKKFDALVSTGRIGDVRIALVLPQTFMNRTGEPIRMAAAFWKVKAKDIIVVSDDFMLPLGAVRMRREGSAGGHNGLRSVIGALGTTAFPRLRIGIGSERMDRVPKDEFVLERFGKDEEDALGSSLSTAVRALEVAAEDGVEAAMNEVN